MVILVTNQPHLREWLERHRNMAIDKVMLHLDVDKVRPGDIVIGTLPINMVDSIREQGGSYFHLVPTNVIQGQRGKALSTAELDAVAFQVMEYVVVSTGIVME